MIERTNNKLFLSRVELNKNAPISTLKTLIDPGDPNKALDAHHRLIWTLFPGPDYNRDFLWRAEGNGTFYILSSRIPTNPGLFKPISTKEFSPVLKPGNNLVFSLRLNATKDKSIPREERGQKSRQRVDLVMDKLRDIPHKEGTEGNIPNTRAELRLKIANEVSNSWLLKKGNGSGFVPTNVICNDYSVRKIPRGKNNHVTIGVLDITGIITIEEPKIFVETLRKGFGRAKAFGCGLMLIRRA